MSFFSNFSNVRYYKLLIKWVKTNHTYNYTNNKLNQVLKNLIPTPIYYKATKAVLASVLF